MSRAIAGRKRSCLARRTMWVLHLNTKQAEILRLMFYIGLTAFVSMGTFLEIRHLIGLPE
jgi:hypothetical protein